MFDSGFTAGFDAFVALHDRVFFVNDTKTKLNEK